MSHPEYDVAIVGLGPVGCLGAVLMAEAGLKVVAVERDEEVYRLPRAVNLDGEIIRALQPSKHAETVDRLVQTLRPGERAGFTNSKREWLFGMDSVPFGSNGWQPMNMFDQPELEQFLRDQALGHPNVTSFIGAECLGFEQSTSSTTVHCQSKNSEFSLTAQFLIGCDGASSFVRKSLGIAWQDLGYNRDWLVVDVTVNDKHTLKSEVLQVCDPDRIHTYVATKDPYRRWEFRLNPGETAEQMLEPETIMALLDDWTPRESYEIRRAAVYQFHAATAKEWQNGRVFLAGDAAHQTPPFLGQGMNAGMRDVINLAWKLKLVIAGKCNDELLTTYEAERNAHAHDLVAWAVSLGQLMEFVAAQEDAERNGKPAPEAPQEMASSGYGQGREQPPIRAGALITEQVSDEGITGYLFNQPIVRTPNGKELKLDELLGSGFALVGNSVINAPLSEQSKQVIEQLDINIVDLKGLDPVRGRLTPLEGNQVAIVRPDRIVFGHTTQDLTIDQLLSRLAECVRLSS